MSYCVIPCYVIVCHVTSGDERLPANVTEVTPGCYSMVTVTFREFIGSVRFFSENSFRTRRGSVRFGSDRFRVRFGPVPELNGSVRFGSAGSVRFLILISIIIIVLLVIRIIIIIIWSIHVKAGAPVDFDFDFDSEVFGGEARPDIHLYKCVYIYI